MMVLGYFRNRQPTPPTNQPSKQKDSEDDIAVNYPLTMDLQTPEEFELEVKKLIDAPRKV